MAKTAWRIGAFIIGVLVIFGLIQLIPYGRNHTNPPVLQEPKWDSPQTRDLAVRACFDCHSNQTVWRWYSNIAPASWLIQSDVDRGRQRLNFSEWGTQRRERRELGETVLEGRMPPWYYLPIHPDAVFSAQEKNQLATGLNSLQ